MNNVVEQMIRASVDELDKCTTEAKKYLLQGDMFNRYIGAYAQNASQLLSLVSNPAICVLDIEANRHFMVGGERWKLFMVAALFTRENGTDGIKTIKCTNPATNSVDTFTTSKQQATQALEEYETMYDQGIERVMRINDLMSGLYKIESNSDKLKVLEEVTSIIHGAIEEQFAMYKAIENGN